MDHLTVVEGRTDEEAQWVCICGASNEDIGSLRAAQADALKHEKEN